MSYANYSSSGGLPLVQPNQTETFRLRINRDKVVDNNKVVSKLRLPKGAAIRSEQMYGTATLAGTPPSAVVEMPYTGRIDLTVSGAGAGDIVYINNPFVSGLASQSVVILNGPDASATLSVIQGQISLTLTGGVDGVYVIRVSI